MRDLPSGPALLGVARDVLLNDLMQLLPEARRLDALLVANCMAIAEREAEAGEGPARAIIRGLEAFYGDDPSPAPSCTLIHTALRAGSPLSRTAGEGAERSEAGEGRADLLSHFAHDLRVGAFESSARSDRDARAILWRLTIAKLRQANPKFLDANGFG